MWISFTKNKAVISLSVMLALLLINCSKDDNNHPNVKQDECPQSHLPENDTVGFRLVNTADLVHCMLIYSQDLKRDSFLIREESELTEIIIGDSCRSKIPQVNFQDSMLIGYKTETGGSGYKNMHLVLFDHENKRLNYIITAFSNDTAMLHTEFNWIALPDYCIDSVSFKLDVN